MTGSNLDTCKRGPPIIKIMGNEQREDALGVGEAGKCKHTHTHSVPRDTQDTWSLRQGSDAILTHIGMTLPQIKLMGYKQREDAVGGGGAGYDKHTQTHTHTQCPM